MLKAQVKPMLVSYQNDDSKVNYVYSVHVIYLPHVLAKEIVGSQI